MADVIDNEALAEDTQLIRDTLERFQAINGVSETTTVEDPEVQAWLEEQGVHSARILLDSMPPIDSHTAFVVGIVFGQVLADRQAD